MNKNRLILPALCIISIMLHAQNQQQDTQITLEWQRPLPHYECVNYKANHLHYPDSVSGRLIHFYNKMESLAMYGEEQINIIYIGGSHIQADVLTNRMRVLFSSLQPAWDGGRGALFPFRAARTNNPTNYSIQYTGIWTKTQNSLPPISEQLGINGMAISTYDIDASISFRLNTSATHWEYNRLRLFATMEDGDRWPMLIVNDDTIPAVQEPDSYVFHLRQSAEQGTITTGFVSECDRLLAKYNSETTDTVNNEEWTDSSDTIRNLWHAMPDSLIIGMENDNGTIEDSIPLDTIIDKTSYKVGKFTIQGFIPESDLNGISLTALGVNGASLPSWLRCVDFETQIPYISPDLMILGIGVNDANVPHSDFDPEIYKSRYRELITRIRKGNPQCDIIFVTNNDCIYRIGKKTKGLNRNTAVVRRALYELASEYNAAVWDLFDIMGGFGSVNRWVSAGLSQRDKIHFTTAGYTLLGDMLFNAIIEDWLYKDTIK